MSRYYSTVKAARICDVSRGTILRWIREGKLPASNTLGGHNKIQAQHLCRLLESLSMPIPEELKQDSRGTTLLIVDDCPDTRALLSKWVRSIDSNIKVLEAGDGFSAGWLARAQHPDLIMLDYELPGMDGAEFCRFLRGIEDFKKTGIVAMTAHGAEKIKMMMEAGADYGICKPFNVQQIQEVLEGMMNINRSAFRQRRSA